MLKSSPYRAVMTLVLL